MRSIGGCAALSKVWKACPAVFSVRAIVLRDARRRFLHQAQLILAPEGHVRRAVLARLQPRQGAIAPVHLAQLAVMRALRDSVCCLCSAARALSCILCRASTIIFMPVIARQERHETLRLALQARADDAGILRPAAPP